MKIHRLSDLMIAQISAGEVIDSPAGVIKELIENSIDAGASEIEVSIGQSGLEKIVVRDNGNGIEKEDLILALESYATSKIGSPDDLFSIATMGFRGEALSSIRSIARVTIESHTGSGEYGWKISGEGDYIGEPEPSPIPSGTRIQVESLFYNVPIRKKFLQNGAKILNEIQELITGYMLGYPEIGFVYREDNRTVFQVPPSQKRPERIKELFPSRVVETLIPFYGEQDGMTVEGYLSRLSSYHSRPSFIRFYVNRRPVNYPGLMAHLRGGYGEMLPSGKYPAAFVFVQANPSLLDVNVHPQKKEIRFDGSGAIDRLISGAVREAFNRGKTVKGSSIYLKKRGSGSPFQPPVVQEELSFDKIAPGGRVGEAVGQVELSSSGGAADAGAGSERVAEAAVGYSKRPLQVHARLFDTFVLASSDQGVYLVDQHTVHERIQYEYVRGQLAKQEVISQPLVEPQPLHLSIAEKEVMERNAKLLLKVGFDFEELGPTELALKSVPVYLKPGEEESAVSLVVKLLLGQEPVDDPAVLFDEMAKSLACRSAIKKGEQASLHDFGEMLEKLFLCEDPARCPHGRPTVIFYGKEDLFNLFKRPL